MRTVVTMAPEADNWNCDAVVIDTESRHLAPLDAAERVRSARSRLHAWGADRFFKKVDSTLRGNLAAEIAAFHSHVIFTPAYPALGRIVSGGVLYVNGIAVTETEFAHDARSPLRQPGSAMLDAASDGDLDRLVQLNPNAAFAGSGGLGRAWVASLPRGTFVPPAPRTCTRPLVVCGSRHPVSRAQAEEARRNGVSVLSSPDEPGDPEREAIALAGRAAEHASDLLVLFGGDTSCAVLRRLRITELWPLRELMPGIALSAGREMMIVTKAGGFGGRHIVAEILGKLT